MCGSPSSPSVPKPKPAPKPPPPPPPPEPTAEAPVVEGAGRTGESSNKKKRGKSALRIPMTNNVPGSSGTSALNIPTG